MSLQEFNRFRHDLRSDPDLLKYLKKSVFGSAAVVEFNATMEMLTEAANAAGYKFTFEEIAFMLKNIAARIIRERR